MSSARLPGSVLPAVEDVAPFADVWAAHAAAGAGLWGCDAATGAVALSTISAHLHGISAPSGVGFVMTSLQDLRARVADEDRGVFDAGMQGRDGVFDVFHYRAAAFDRPDGVRWIEVRPRLVPGGQDSPRHLVGLHLDVTSRVEIERAIKTSEAQLQVSEETLALTLNVLAKSGHGLSDWFCDEQSFWISDAWGKLLGYHDAPSTTEFWIGIVHPEDRPAFIASRQTLIEGQVSRTEQECRLRRADGTFLWALLRHMAVETKADGRLHRLVGTMIDITKRKEDELRMLHMAEHDALTGLPNRRPFRRCLEETIARSKTEPYHYALLICDLDRFQAVNDARGHLIGDRVLCLASERIGNALRPTDMVARLSGDEFAVILGEVGEDAVRRACERIIGAMRDPLVIDEFSFNIGVSIGSALLSGDDASADEIIKRADIALSIAKRGGENTFRLFDAATHGQMQSRSLLALDMKDSIRCGDFYLLYQPVVDVSTGRVASFEALMRWRHPIRGEVSPVEFIPVAEETGMIEPLGTWALSEACREARHWSDAIRVAVNVSTLQINAGLEGAISAALDEADLDPTRLKLEITESALILDPDLALAVLHRVRRLGVRIALDDFGTGYSSLSYLRRFPFDKIKIDRAFIKDIADPDAAAIVRALVGIGRRLNMGIVAEGVETAEQLDLIRREGCEEVQGFFFSKPLAPHDVPAFLRSMMPYAEG